MYLFVAEIRNIFVSEFKNIFKAEQKEFKKNIIVFLICTQSVQNSKETCPKNHFGVRCRGKSKKKRISWAASVNWLYEIELFVIFEATEELIL